MFGAGHNALGAWWWLASAGRLPLKDGGGSFVQEIGDRLLPVEVVGRNAHAKAIWMTQATPQFGDTVDAEDRGALATALGLDAHDLGDSPAQVASTGAAHLLVAANRDAVDRAQPDSAPLAAALRTVGAQGCYLYSLDPVDADAIAHARFFNPTVGIWEDPATGVLPGRS